jgi:hypothetical protein
MVRGSMVVRVHFVHQFSSEKPPLISHEFEGTVSRCCVCAWAIYGGQAHPFTPCQNKFWLSHHYGGGQALGLNQMFVLLLGMGYQYSSALSDCENAKKE